MGFEQMSWPFFNDDQAGTNMTKPWLHLTIISGLVFILAAPALADFQVGMDAYERADYDTALNEFKPLAEGGDRVAQYYMGKIFENTIDYSTKETENEEYRQVAYWFGLASQNGYPPAQFELSGLYLSGTGVPEDDNKGFDLFRQSATNGYAEAQYFLGIEYFSGKNVKQDDTEGAYWIQLSAEQGYEFAQSLLARVYEEGKGVPQDCTKAAQWWRTIIEGKGDMADMANYELAGVSCDFQSLPLDKRYRLYREAAEEGYIKAYAEVVLTNPVHIY